MEILTEEVPEFKGGIMAVSAAIIGAVAAIASAAISYKTSQDQADAQEDYNKSLRDDAIRQYAELDKKEVEAIESSYKESLEAQRSYLQARSSIELQSAATGTYGKSVDSVIRDLNAGFGQRISDITTRRDRFLTNIDTQAMNLKEAVGRGSDYTIQQPAYISAMSTGLNTFSRTYSIASAVGGAFTNSSTPKTTPTTTK